MANTVVVYLCQTNYCITFNVFSTLQGHHLSGKPGNVREFDSCLGNVRDFTKNQGNVMEKNLVREKLPKTVSCKLNFHNYI